MRGLAVAGLGLLLVAGCRQSVPEKLRAHANDSANAVRRDDFVPNGWVSPKDEIPMRPEKLKDADFASLWGEPEGRASHSDVGGNEIYKSVFWERLNVEADFHPNGKLFRLRLNRPMQRSVYGLHVGDPVDLTQSPPLVKKIRDPNFTRDIWVCTANPAWRAEFQYPGRFVDPKRPLVTSIVWESNPPSTMRNDRIP